jgi:hypothetical protein
MAKIEEDDPLGAMLIGVAPADEAAKEGEEHEDESEGHEMAGALIDAIHAKDPAAVYDAMKGLQSFMKPPGEDDEDMPPSSESGKFPEEDEE